MASIRKVRRQPLRRLVGRDVLRNLHVVDEALVETRVLAAGERVGDHVERGIARGEMGGRQPREVEALELHLVGHRLLLDAGQRHAGNGHRLDARAALDVAKPFFHQPACRRGVDVARDDQAGVARRVVLLEELHDVVVAGRRQVGHVADDGPVIGMALRIQHLAKRQFGRAVRTIFVTLAPLVLDDVALGVHRFRRHRLEEVAHAVRFEEERKLEGVRRDVDPVVGAIVFGRTVVRAAGALQPVVELAGLHVRRAHEHQVFEQMGEAGASGALARRPDVVVHVRGDDGDVVVLVQDHRQPIRQRELRVGQLYLGRRRRGRRGAGLCPRRRGHGERGCKE